jgi:hypothetical protein
MERKVNEFKVKGITPFYVPSSGTTAILSKVNTLIPGF